MLIGVHGDRDVDLVGTISVTPDEEVIGARIIGRPRRIGGKWRAVPAGDFGQVDLIGQRLRAAADRDRPGGEDRRHREHQCSARSEEHTSELQSLMRISYAVLCLKKKTVTSFGT